MDIRSLASNLIGIADKLIPMFGGPLGASAVEIGHIVVDAINNIKDDIGGSDQVELQDKLEELEAKVKAHADKTIASLDG